MCIPVPFIWSSPSRDSAGSMPLGNGDIGLNVWVEADGDLVCYLSKTDAWDEHARLLKLGRIRVALTPTPFIAGAPFQQRLDLAHGLIHIQAAQVDIHIWVDANRPVVRVEIDSPTSVAVRAVVERWRTTERPREGAEAHCAAGLRTPDDQEIVTPDIIFPEEGDTVRWCHYNERSCWAATLEHQHMADWTAQGQDPLIGRIFGALMHGDGLVHDGDDALRTSSPTTRVTLGIHPLTAQLQTLDAWVQAVTAQVAATNATPVDAAFADHTAWWQAFWQRSTIAVSGTPEAAMVSQGYAFQRFLNACGGRGAFPIKFNGSIFTVDAREPDEVFDADYRRWGGGYWFQNTRLTYWAMLMSGDRDLLEPWFRMYVDALPLAKARARMHFGIDDAALFPETMTFWGTYLNGNYGYQRGDLPPGLTENRYIRRYWQGMLELLAVLLDAYAIFEDEALLRETLLVLAPPFLRFYRACYTQRDEDGYIRLAPSQSLETWHEAVNPTPDIAGLHWVLDGLLALPDGIVPCAQRAEWEEFRQLLPPLPTRTYVWEQRTKVLPALQYDQCANSENPALYAVFPYRLFGVGQPDLDIGRATYAARPVKGTGGWRQDAIQAALLGLTAEAQRDVVANYSTTHPGSRFPVFWGPNFDWIPDQDHGSVASIALQRMVLQWDNGKLYLLPAWPQEWDVTFTLYAPGQTTVECIYRTGRIERLVVTPTERHADIMLPEWLSATPQNSEETRI